MQFRDLGKQYSKLRAQIDEGIQEVIDSSSFISGKQVADLEHNLAEYVGVKHCVTCGNGTDALSMALMAWNLKEGECAFVPDFTFFASGETVAFTGATPIFVDVDENTYNMDSLKLEEAIQKVLAESKLIPRVVVAVDLFGLPADYDAIRPIADKYGLKILEDGAQGFGGEINGRRACSFGDIAITSFFPAKPLGCYGDGGAIFTNVDEVDAYLRSIRVHGMGKNKYDNVRIGWNSRLDTIQAAILLPKLQAFIEYERDNVNHVAARYTEHLKDIVETPIFDTKYISSWAQYCIKLKSRQERDGLQEYLRQKGIPTMIYYPKPMHMQAAFNGANKVMGSCSTTERLCETVLALPMHPYLEADEIDMVTNCIKTYFEEK